MRVEVTSMRIGMTDMPVEVMSMPRRCWLSARPVILPSFGKNF